LYLSGCVHCIAAQIPGVFPRNAQQKKHTPTLQEISNTQVIQTPKCFQEMHNRKAHAHLSRDSNRQVIDRLVAVGVNPRRFVSAELEFGHKLAVRLILVMQWHPTAEGRTKTRRWVIMRSASVLVWSKL